MDPVFSFYSTSARSRQIGGGAGTGFPSIPVYEGTGVFSTIFQRLILPFIKAQARKIVRRGARKVDDLLGSGRDTTMEGSGPRKRKRRSVSPRQDIFTTKRSKGVNSPTLKHRDPFVIKKKAPPKQNKRSETPINQRRKLTARRTKTDLFGYLQR